MSYYTYEHFCGANVVVQVEGLELHEAAGISFGVRESKLPLYGYSSRHFDSLARGQVLVQGSILTNYVHQDYLYRAIQVGREDFEDAALGSQRAVDPNLATRLTQAEALIDLEDHLGLENANREEFANTVINNPRQNLALISSFQKRYWHAENTPFFNVAPLSGSHTDPTGLNPHDLATSVEIKITFGQRSSLNNRNGVTGLLLSGVYFLSRGLPIQIDEEVIVEEYSFIARNIHTLNSETVIEGSYTEDGELEIEVLGSVGPGFPIVFGTDAPSSVPTSFTKNNIRASAANDMLQDALL